jgi:hypothetical protein
MIVFGTRGKAVPGPRKQGVVCPSCGKEEHATYGVLRYFHVFWIPVFPTTRQAMMECLHCKKVLRGKEVPERVRRDVAAKVFTRGRMVPMFSGLILIAILAIPVSLAQQENARREAAWLQAPAVGDCYVVKLAAIGQKPNPKYPYGVLRATRVGGASLQLELGAYAYTGAAGAEKAIRSGEIGKPGYFGAAPMSLAIEDLQRLKAGGGIASVKRP